MPDDETLILYRPVGPAELDLVRQSEMLPLPLRPCGAERVGVRWGIEARRAAGYAQHLSNGGSPRAIDPIDAPPLRRQPHLTPTLSAPKGRRGGDQRSALRGHALLKCRRCTDTFAYRIIVLLLAAASTLAAPGSLRAAEAATPHLDGAALGLAWVLPFAGILLSIALLPMLVPKFWHGHFGKVSAFWAAAFLIPFAATFGVRLASYEVLYEFLLEYLPFILLLFALFVVAGGIRVADGLVATPAMNTGILAFGTMVASLLGTTGAAMILLRLLIQANQSRRRSLHVFIFFIILVANIGGSLTPLGDPPLFLGFLQGVDFTWTLYAMFAPMLLCSAILLAAFYAIDHRIWRSDGALTATRTPWELRLEGSHNLLLLAGVVGAVLLSGVWHPKIVPAVFGVPVPLAGVVRDLLLVLLAWLSWRTTPASVRIENAFTWEPIQEVALLFAGIFVTIIPALAILKAGSSGALADLVALVESPSGGPNNVAYFWLTGLLSSFLDNAPTYLVFFNLAGGDSAALMGPQATTLLAISAGSVFFGALTYIGNAPNFMVKSICEERGIRMPSFLGYMAWSCAILLPLFALVTLIFFWG